MLSQLKTVTGALYRIQRSLNNQYQSPGNDEWNSGSLSLRQNAANDGAALTSNGRAFQARAAVTGNARSPSVERHVAGTTNVIELAEQRRRRPSTSAASCSDLERYNGMVLCRHR